MIFLGDDVQDTVTGYQGVATIRQEHLGGHTRWCVERLTDEGQPEDAWFDEARLNPTTTPRPETHPLGFRPPPNDTTTPLQ